MTTIVFSLHLSIELERVLLGHECVADCAVVGVYESSQATELPRAYVVLQPSVKASAATAKDISDYVANNVINYKRLRGGIRFIDAIPKNASGKILRREIKKWIKAEQEKEGAGVQAKL